MKLRLGLLTLLCGSLSVFGCGSDEPESDAGTGGTGGTGGDGGVELADCDPAENATHCIRCAPDVLPPLIAATFPDGLAIPVTVTGAPDTVAAGGATEVTLTATTTVVGVAVEVSGTVNEGSTSNYMVTAGGTGAADVVIPAGTFESVEQPGSDPVVYDFTVDAGMGPIEVTADSDATEVTVSMDSATLDLSITVPLEQDLVITAGEGEDCAIEGPGLTLDAETPS